MRLIDAGEFQNRIRKYSMDCYEQGDVRAAQVFEDVVSEIDDSPTVDPVKHGKWVGGGSGLDKCSACAMRGFNNWEFCPRCGAKMDLEA